VFRQVRIDDPARLPLGESTGAKADARSPILSQTRGNMAIQTADRDGNGPLAEVHSATLTGHSGLTHATFLVEA
jgi:hypothetical protein